MTYEDSKKQKCFENFAAEEYSSYSHPVERVYDTCRQLKGIDMILSFKDSAIKIDVKHCCAKSASLGWDIAEIKNYKDKNGGKSRCCQGWFTKNDSETDVYIQYMVVPYKSGYLIEEYGIKKEYVMEFYKEKLEQWGIPEDMESIKTHEILAYRKSLNKNRDSEFYDKTFVINNTIEEDKNNSAAKHVTVFFLTKADWFVKHFKDKVVTRYFYSDTDDCDKIKFSNVERVDVNIRHKWIANPNPTEENPGHFVAIDI